MRAEAYTRLTHSTANKRIVPCYIIVACTGVRCSDCNQPSCTYRACYREMLINRSETVQRKFPCSRKRLQIRVRTSNGLADWSGRGTIHQVANARTHSNHHRCTYICPVCQAHTRDDGTHHSNPPVTNAANNRSICSHDITHPAPGLCVLVNISAQP